MRKNFKKSFVASEKPDHLPKVMLVGADDYKCKDEKIRVSIMKSEVTKLQGSRPLK